MAAPLIYAHEIKSLIGPAKPQLNTRPTNSVPVDTMLILFFGGRARLDAGPADPVDPGHIVPLDYNAEVNNKHWTVLA